MRPCFDGSVPRLASRIGLCVLLVASAATGHPPERALAVPAFTAPEELSIFAPEVARAVSEALARAGFEIAPAGLRVDGKIEVLDAERVRLQATVGGRAAQVDGRLEEIDGLAIDLAQRVAQLAPASIRRTVAHAAPWRRTYGKAPAGSPPGDRPAGAPGDPSNSVGILPPGLTPLPATPTQPPAITPPADHPGADKPIVKADPATAPKENTTPVAAPAEPAKPDPPAPLAPTPPVVEPARVAEVKPIEPPPRRAVAPIPPIPPPHPATRVVLHAIHTPSGCNPDDPAVAMARQVLTRNGVDEIVVDGCGIPNYATVAAETRRANAIGVVMSQVLWMRMENTAFGYRAVGEVRVVALRDGRVMVNDSQGLTSRILPSPDPQRGATELASLAFQRLGRAIGLAFQR